MSVSVRRMRPPLVVEHDGGVEIGDYGWGGGELLAEPGTVLFVQTPAHLKCCVDKVCDRICTGCGHFFCSDCAPEAGLTAEGAGTCPGCSQIALYMNGHVPVGNQPHPTFQGF